MNKEEIIKFCEKFLPAWTGNQPEELIKFYDKNAFYLDPAKPDGLKGHKQILPYFNKLLALNPDWVWEAVEIFPSSEHCFTAKWKATIPVGPEVVIENGIDIIEVISFPAPDYQRSHILNPRYFCCFIYYFLDKFLEIMYAIYNWSYEYISYE